MSRGRKPKSENNNLNWQEFFNKNVGIYLQNIIVKLGQAKKSGSESSVKLLEEIKNKKTQNKNIFLNINEEEIPFLIPKNWVWCRLGEIIEFSENLNIETKLDKDTLINYVDIDAIDNQNHKIRESKLRTVSELSSRARRVLKKGHIMYSLVRPYLNNIAIVEKDETNHIGSTGFAVFNGILVNNKYLKYILLSDYVRQLFLSMLSGFNSPTISQEQFISTPIPLPPITEQNNILAFLSDFENENIKSDTFYFDKKIEADILNIHNSQLFASKLSNELVQQLTQIENLNQAILQEAVQGKLVKQDKKDEPASKLLQRIKAEKEKLGKKEKVLAAIKADEIPFEIPENWVWCKIGDVSKSIVPNRDKPKTFTGNIPWITQSNFSDFSYNLDYDLNGIGLSAEEIKKYNCRIMPKGSIIMSCVGQFDLVCLIERNIVANQQLHCFVPFGNIEPMYLCYSLKLFSKLMEKEAIHTTIKYINKTKCESIILPLPPLTEQKRIVAEIEKQLTKTKQLKEHIIANQQATEQLLKALLHEAFEVA
jgi:type I restriction enzyme, S subunit